MLAFVRSINFYSNTSHHSKSSTQIYSGLLLIGLVNVPNLITSSTGGFNMVALKAAMLGLFPIVRSCIMF